MMFFSAPFFSAPFFSAPFFSAPFFSAPFFFMRTFFLQRTFYPAMFRRLHPYISYFSSRQRDFGALERQARAVMQDMKDQGVALVEQLEEQKRVAEETLSEVRRVAAETGVAHHAEIFREEAEKHSDEAKLWFRRLMYSSGTFILFAMASLSTNYIDSLAPVNAFQAISINVSKFLVLGGIGYFVVLCGKNYVAARHNNVVNRHRLNALRTFQVLVAAAKTEENKDIVLNYAAACIFSPQDTGFTRAGQQI
jgi:hypothetical protein